MHAALLSAFLFGAVVAITLGPIAVLIVRLGVTRGWRSACLAGLGAALGDLVWAWTAFLSGSLLASLLVGRERYFKLGCAVLLAVIAVRMALAAIRSWKAGTLPDATEAEKQMGKYGELLGTFTLTCCNPLTVLLFGGFLVQIDHAIPIGQALLLGVVLFLGSLVVQMSLALGSAAVRPLVATPGRVLTVNLLAATLLVFFAVSGVLSA